MNALRYRLGFALRETGQAVERLGATLQGINSFEEHSAYSTVALVSRLAVVSGAFGFICALEKPMEAGQPCLARKWEHATHCLPSAVAAATRMRHAA